MWWRKVRRFAAARAEIELALADAEQRMTAEPEDVWLAGYFVGLQTAAILCDWDKTWEERARARADARGQ